MSEQSEVLGASVAWLLNQWTNTFTSVLTSMTEEHPVMNWVPDGLGELSGDALVVEQSFKSFPEAMLWIGLPETVHQELGRLVLSAAGVDASDAEENRATTLEIVEQSVGGLVSALNVRLSRDIRREPSKQLTAFPGELTPIRAVITIGEKTLAPVWIVFNPLLVSWLEAASARSPTERVSQVNRELPEPVTPARDFDLLLDVALPVSVSFGKTELAVKDVLKLTTGSIVELNRAVSEPVDVIVNNCVIARGEVVVVEGNYGVRILNLVSRKERLRTGGAAVVESRARLGAV